MHQLNVLKFLISKRKGKVSAKYLLSLLISLLSLTAAPAQDIQIKSLEVYTSRERLVLPVIIKGEKLIIEFDVESDYEPLIKIIFRFCDYGWNPTLNTFLYNPNRNFLNLFDFVRLPVTVQDADFHYKGSFPDKDEFIEFPFSGKWRFYVTDLYDDSIVYAEGKFFVIKDEFDLHSVLKRDELEDKIYWPKELAKVFNITTEFYLPEEFFPNFVDRLEIIENKVMSDPIIVNRDDNTLERQFKWDANRRFIYIARDIQAGNEYRQADLRNVNYFMQKDVKAQRDGLEYSRFFLNAAEDLNGNKIFTNHFDPYATYMNVTFSIRPPESFYNDIFLVGAFNDWEVSPEYKLESSGGIHSITIPLKRGIYDYQYVAADEVNGEVINTDWLIMEGNTWANKKEYNIFLYYTETELGGYERIIGYNKLPREQ